MATIGDRYDKREGRGRTTYVCRNCTAPVSRNSLTAHAERCEPRFALGDRVRAVAVTSWGEGTVIRLSSNPREKLYVVARADGEVGYFHPDQIELTA